MLVTYPSIYHVATDPFEGTNFLDFRKLLADDRLLTMKLSWKQLKCSTDSVSSKSRKPVDHGDPTCKHTKICSR